MGQVNNYFYRWSCVPLQEQCTTHLKNNTPVNTEVLLGGGFVVGGTKDKRPRHRSDSAGP